MVQRRLVIGAEVRVFLLVNHKTDTLLRPVMFGNSDITRVKTPSKARLLLVQNKTVTTPRSCTAPRPGSGSAEQFIIIGPRQNRHQQHQVFQPSNPQETRQASSRCTVYWSTSKPSLGIPGSQKGIQEKIMSNPQLVVKFCNIKTMINTT